MNGLKLPSMTLLSSPDVFPLKLLSAPLARFVRFMRFDKGEMLTYRGYDRTSREKTHRDG